DASSLHRAVSKGGRAAAGSRKATVAWHPTTDQAVSRARQAVEASTKATRAATDHRLDGEGGGRLTDRGAGAVVGVDLDLGGEIVGVDVHHPARADDLGVGVACLGQ